MIYDRAMAGEAYGPVERSRTAAAFASLQQEIEAQMPDEAPSWIVRQYEGLVGACGA